MCTQPGTDSADISLPIVVNIGHPRAWQDEEKTLEGQSCLLPTSIQSLLGVCALHFVWYWGTLFEDILVTLLVDCHIL